MTQNAPTTMFGLDENKKEILLKEGSLQVMMEWEKPYMEACVAALQPRGDVLEIGFGLGYSATAIQKFLPASHTIIECDPTVIKKTKEWAEKYTNIRIVEDMWQHAMPMLGVYDTIFFDDYCPLSPKEAQEMEQAKKRVGGKLEEIQALRDTVEAALRQFEGARFTDEDLQVFGAELLTRPGVPLQDVINFVYSLVISEHISSEQAEKFIAEFKSRVAARKKEELAPQSPPISWSTLSGEYMGDRLIAFIEMCLTRHMRKGSRLSSFISSPDATKRAEFQERIISRKDVLYSEKVIPVVVPQNCTYYKGDKALVMVIEKK
jgi:hypothetical protein